MTKALIIASFLSLFVLTDMYGQDDLYGDEVDTTTQVKKERKERDGEWKKKMFYGGNLGLQFGSPTIVNLLPLVGYRMTDKWMAGGGPIYMYYKIGDFSDSRWGGRLMQRYYVLENVFAHMEYEVLETSYWDYSTNPWGEYSTRWVPSFMMGAGYSQSLGGSATLNFMALYILNYNIINSPYPSPFVLRAGITF